MEQIFKKHPFHPYMYSFNQHTLEATVLCIVIAEINKA